MVPDSLRIAYARGVTPGKWARTWGERFPRIRLELVLIDPVTDADAELAPLRDGAVDLAFIRLPIGASAGAEGGRDTDAEILGEALWPAGSRPDDIHFIPLYDERAFVVAPKGNVLEAADEVVIADVAGEVKHPFDDDIATTVEVVAANVGVVVVPQSIARLYARKDVVARPVADLPGWRVGIAWLRSTSDPRVDDFIGVVRGRTANSSRGADSQGADTPGAGPARRGSARDAGPGPRPRARRPGRGSRRSH